MSALVRRDRLLTTLGQRHRLTLCALVAPAGFGRTVLLEQASEALPFPARDIRYDCSFEDAEPGQLGIHLCAAVADADAGADDGALDGAPVEGAPGSVERLTAQLAACDRRRPTALCVDRFERAGTVGSEFLRRLVAGAPEGVHLVISTRRLSQIGLGRLVVAGTGRLIGWRDLAFDGAELARLDWASGAPDPHGDEVISWPALAFLRSQGATELMTDYLQDEVLTDEPQTVVRALAALAAIGGCTTEELVDATRPVLEGLVPIDRDDVLDRVAELPLVGRGAIGCWPHPVWARATRTVLAGPERRRVVHARIATLLARGETSEAGRMAVDLADPDALRAVVRSALGSLPVAASTADQRSWQRAELLQVDGPEELWLDAVLRAFEDDEPTRYSRLEEVRGRFETAADSEGETGVILQLGNLARARGDGAALVSLLGRARELAAVGDLRAESLVALGQAIAAQLAGRPDDAVRAVDSVVAGSLPPDWAAQALMIRGTNLLLGGRFDAAVSSLEAATGEGSEGSLATAYDLLSTARWQAGDPHGALDDAALSVSLSARAGSPARLQLSQSWLACLYAATGQEWETRELLEQLLGSGPFQSAESAALTAVAEALLLCATDKESARLTVESVDAPDRPVRSSLWRRALLDALSADGTAASDIGVPQGFERAVAAGAAGRDALAGGSPAAARHRPYLPARWCVATPASTTVALFGIGTVRRDHRIVEHPAWQRARVRELCLHLAVISQAPRAQVAATLWPDRDERSAGQNLRVTLSHLLDVLDPERDRTQGSTLLTGMSGALGLDPDSGLRVDVWEVQRHAAAVLETHEDQHASVLAHARRLVAARTGPLLDATPLGEWCGPYRRRIDDLVRNAAGRAGQVALRNHDADLAADLGRLMLAVDPWSENGHSLVIEGRLVGGDLDGARHSLLEATGLLHDLGVAPGRDLVLLGYRLGLSSQRRGDPAREAARA